MNRDLSKMLFPWQQLPRHRHANYSARYVRRDRYGENIAWIWLRSDRKDWLWEISSTGLTGFDMDLQVAMTKVNILLISAGYTELPNRLKVLL